MEKFCDIAKHCLQYLQCSHTRFKLSCKCYLVLKVPIFKILEACQCRLSAIEKCAGNWQAIKFNSIFINTVNQTAGICGFSGTSGVILGTLAAFKPDRATIFLLISLHRFLVNRASQVLSLGLTT